MLDNALILQYYYNKMINKKKIIININNSDKEQNISVFTFIYGSFLTNMDIIVYELFKYYLFNLYYLLFHLNNKNKKYKFLFKLNRKKFYDNYSESLLRANLKYIDSFYRQDNYKDYKNYNDSSNIWFLNFITNIFPEIIYRKYIVNTNLTFLFNIKSKIICSNKIEFKNFIDNDIITCFVNILTTEQQELELKGLMKMKSETELVQLINNHENILIQMGGFKAFYGK